MTDEERGTPFFKKVLREEILHAMGVTDEPRESDQDAEVDAAAPVGEGQEGQSAWTLRPEPASAAVGQQIHPNADEAQRAGAEEPTAQSYSPPPSFAGYAIARLLNRGFRIELIAHRGLNDKMGLHVDVTHDAASECGSLRVGVPTTAETVDLDAFDLLHFAARNIIR